MKKKSYHYFAVKIFSALLHCITSKHKGDFYCLTCLHYFRIQNKLKSHEKVRDICPAFISKISSNRKKQIIFFMISNEEIESYIILR